MAVDKLGDRIDIHSGGIDLSFPHHDNEIARESFPLASRSVLPFELKSNLALKRNILTPISYRKRGILLSWQQEPSTMGSILVRSWGLSCFPLAWPLKEQC